MSSSHESQYIRLVTAVATDLRIANDTPILAFEPPDPAWLTGLRSSPVITWEPNAARCSRLAEVGIPWIHVVPDSCSAAVVFCTKFKVRNFWNIARAWKALAPGGELICFAENAVGAPSLGKFLKANFAGVEVSTAPRAKLFRVPKSEDGFPPVLTEFLRLSEGLPVPGTSLISYPGVFSAKGPDPGSQLLLSTLPENLSGRGCDLGAGYGYLSHGILQRSHSVTSIDLYEIDALGIEAAQRNLAEVVERTTLRFHWHDVTIPIHSVSYDWVITNPPFHIGAKAAVSLGQEFIRRAASVLPKGGRLFLVANATLPYNSVLSEAFSNWELVTTSQGYKAIHARK